MILRGVTSDGHVSKSRRWRTITPFVSSKEGPFWQLWQIMLNFQEQTRYRLLHMPSSLALFWTFEPLMSFLSIPL